MHLVSCRQSTSGRTDLRNLATISIRRRTELMFQGVSDNRMERTYYRHCADRKRPSRGARDKSRDRAACARRKGSAASDEAGGSARRRRIVGEVDLEQARIDLLGEIEIVNRD